MPVSPPVVPFTRYQQVSHAAQTPRRQVAHHLIPIESPRSSEAIVHIVCNDADQVSSLTDLLSSRAINVHDFRTATDFMSSAGSERIACVILDLDLPDISGLEVQSRLADKEGPPVVFVTAHGDLNSGVRAMKNGAIDFMIEPIDRNRLLAAVEAAFVQDRNNRRERFERSSLLRRWNSLTPREQEVFQYAVAGFLNKQAAWELGITENTFQVHRGRVMRKMEADSLAELVRMATRLEPLIPSVTKTGGATQPLETLLRGQGNDNPTGFNASSTAYPSSAR
jgi:FixJ family two-component response regulator